MDKKCFFEDCQIVTKGHLLWNGRPYCFKHYQESMSKEIEKEWSCWEDNMLPSRRLLDLLGRRMEEDRWTQIDGFMTRGRLRDRGFNFLKGDTGFTFEITRHPGAFKNPSAYIVNRVVEKWKVSLQDRIIERIGERPWTVDDPDMNY